MVTDASLSQLLNAEAPIEFLAFPMVADVSSDSLKMFVLQ